VTARRTEPLVTETQRLLLAELDDADLVDLRDAYRELLDDCNAELDRRRGRRAASSGSGVSS
jgi:hypothetical protein